MPIIIEGFTLEKYDAWEADRFRKFHIDTAERALTAKVARKQFVANPVVITDGRPKKDYHEVKLFGVIEFAARPAMVEAVRWALEKLREKSPVLTGRYRGSHLILINGEEVSKDVAAALAAVKPGDRVQIVNPQPYARKIEGATASSKTGRGARKALSRQAPSGVYRVVQRQIVQRYGKTIFVDFNYRKLNTGVKVWGDDGGRYYTRRKKEAGTTVRHHGRRVLRDQVYPVLSLFIKDDTAS